MCQNPLKPSCSTELWKKQGQNSDSRNSSLYRSKLLTFLDLNIKCIHQLLHHITLYCNIMLRFIDYINSITLYHIALISITFFLHVKDWDLPILKFDSHRSSATRSLWEFNIEKKLKFYRKCISLANICIAISPPNRQQIISRQAAKTCLISMLYSAVAMVFLCLANKNIKHVEHLDV